MEGIQDHTIDQKGIVDGWTTIQNGISMTDSRLVGRKYPWLALTHSLWGEYADFQGAC